MLALGLTSIKKGLKKLVSIKISKHGLRHIPKNVQKNVSNAVKKDIIENGGPAVNQTIQRTIEINGKKYSYRAHGLGDGTTNVGTMVEGDFTRIIGN